jgi:hypothetical protein
MCDIDWPDNFERAFFKDFGPYRPLVQYKCMYCLNTYI